MRALILAGSVIVVMCGVFITAYISNANYGHRSETIIKTEYKNMENVLGQYSLKVAEAAQVPGMYRDDMKDVMTSVMEARQGSGGSKAVFQFFKEHQINIDPGLYAKIQQIIEGGRNKFENRQTKFLETKNAYETNLGYWWKGFWLNRAGYPKIDLDSYKIISSDHAIESFSKGVDKGLTLR